MGYITVERQVIYLRAKPYSGDKAQTHLWVETRRIPWGNDTTARSVLYMDDDLFGGVTGKVNGQSIEAMKRFFLGEGAKYPKLLVADVSAQDLMSKTEISKKFFEGYKRQLKDVSNIGVPAQNPLDEDSSFKLKMARYRLGRSPAGTRVLTRPVRGVEKHYKAHFGKHYFNTVWTVYDPTKPGKQKIPKDRALRLAKSVLNTKFANVLYQGHRGHQKLMDKDSVVILGVGFMLQYWDKTPAPDVVRLADVDRRVRIYTHNAFKGLKKEEHVTRDPGQIWYAIGKYKLPILSTRFKPTSKGRVKRYATLRSGHGIVSIRPDEEYKFTPLFTVKGKNMADARENAERKIEGMRKIPGLKEKALDLGNAWNAANRKMVSKNALKMLQRSMKNQ